ncbi:MAG: phosphoglucosamine mutase, partial [Rhodobiaceae bacterium]|nr:phosphoglucosamine mutase [Rhodobiaceae bacterium]
ADIGIALDGDADRVLIVDENSHVIDGDQLMATVASAWKDDGRLSTDGVVATIMSNLGFERYLDGIGLTLARTPVGDRYVVDYMRRNGFNLGGEQSGHIILSDYSTTGDGLVAALQVLAVVKKHDQPVSQVCNLFEPLPQILKNVRTRNADVLEQEPVIKVIADGEKTLGNAGRIVIRKSGTEPVIRVMAEGDDPFVVESVVDNIVDAITHQAA